MTEEKKERIFDEELYYDPGGRPYVVCKNCKKKTPAWGAGVKHGQHLERGHCRWCGDVWGDWSEHDEMVKEMRVRGDIK